MEEKANPQEEALEALKAQALSLDNTRYVSGNLQGDSEGKTIKAAWNRNNDEILFVTNEGKTYIMPAHPGIAELMDTAGFSKNEELSVPHMSEIIVQERINRDSATPSSGKSMFEKDWVKLQENASMEIRNKENENKGL